MGEPIEHTGRAVRRHVVIHAPRERVWRAWTDNADHARWFMDDLKGDVAEGETIIQTFEDFGAAFPVRVHTVEEPGRLVLAMPGPGGDVSGHQEVLLHADGSDTRVELIHSGFGEGEDWDDMYASVDSGWLLALAALKHYLENHDGEPRQHRLVQQKAEFAWPDAVERYTTADGLRAWLADEADLTSDPLEAGATARLDLTTGGTLGGTVLAVSDREVLLEWPEERGTLALKAWTMGPAGRMLGCDLNLWGAEDGRADTLASALGNALDRLRASLPA